MIDRQQGLVLGAILLLALLVTLPNLLREYPIGMDSYYYLHYAGTPQEGMPPLFFYLSGQDPVMVSFLVTALVLLLSYLIYNQLGVADSVFPTALLLAAPGLIFRMAFFEDDLIGIVACLLLVLLYLKEHNKPYRFVALAGFIATYFYIWRGAVLFAGMILVYEAVRRYGAVCYALLLGLLAVPNLHPSLLIGENAFGFLFIPITLLGAFTGIKGFTRTKLFVQVWFIVMLAVGLLQAKWLWLCAFPLAFMIWDTIKDEPRKKAYGVMIMLIGVGLLFGGWMTFQTQPTAQQIADAQEIVEVTGGSVCNSWQYGHWLRWAGGNPTVDNLHPEDSLPLRFCKTEWVLSYEELSLPGYYPFKVYSLGVLYRKAQAVTVSP